jgi:hypothetical protein
MFRSALALGTAVGVFALMSAGPVRAAELQTPPRAVRPASCGPCGCLQVAYVYHRNLLSTYGTGFDPRNYDTTQPHYYFSRSVHAYPRYYVDGVLLPDQCPPE